MGNRSSTKSGLAGFVYTEDTDGNLFMSGTFFTSLVLGGIALLIVIAYGAHRAETMRIERARRSALHRDRARDLTFILEVLPESEVAVALIGLVFRNIRLHLDKAGELDIHNLDIRRRSQDMATLERAFDKTGEYAQGRSSGSIGEQLKDTQRALKILKEFILQQHRGGVIGKADAMKFIRSLHEINLKVMVDGLIFQGKHNLGQGNLSLGLHYYQLAMGELVKNNQAGKHHEGIIQLTQTIRDLKAGIDETDGTGGSAGDGMRADQMTSEHDPEADVLAGTSGV